MEMNEAPQASRGRHRSPGRNALPRRADCGTAAGGASLARLAAETVGLSPGGHRPGVGTDLKPGLFWLRRHFRFLLSPSGKRRFHIAAAERISTTSVWLFSCLYTSWSACSGATQTGSFQVTALGH